MREFWNTIQLVFTAVGGWLGWFLGGSDGLLYALIAFVVIDYITGIMCAVADKKLSSAVGFKGICKKVLIFALAEYNLSLARYDFEPPATLDNLEIAAVLAKADELISWVTDVKEYALRQALSGVTYDGFKVVEGRSNRKYTDENAVVNAVEAAGFDPYEHNVLGITAMTALLGKKKFNELLGGLVEKPQGKPTLVPMSDKRPAIHTANEDFKEDN